MDQGIVRPMHGHRPSYQFLNHEKNQYQIAIIHPIPQSLNLKERLHYLKKK